MKKNINAIGLDVEKSTALAAGLKDLLANYQLFYQNLRGFHWNIKGEKFFELHLKFEELYNDVILKVDEIAERILTLGSTPLHTFSDYLAKSEIREEKNLSDSASTVESTLNSFKILIVKERAMLSNAQQFGDEGTATLMSDYISQQEKTVWMLSAYQNR